MLSNRTLPAVVAGLLIALLLPGAQAASAVLYQPEQDSERIPGQPYFRFFTGDKYERRIVFYLSEEPEGAEPLPLVAYVQGSGAQSLFVADGDAVRGNMGHDTVADAFRGRARLLIVEKPGVAHLATEPSAAFRQEHTLERWVEAVHAALEAARKLPEVAPGKILVIGHSEGGLVAARLAADLEWVTHVALLFPVDSPMKALSESDARIYLAQGSDVVADRVEGADPDFVLEGRNGRRELMDRIAAWFMGEAPK